MGFESLKTKKLWGEFEHKILSGNGIDIGCGPYPVTEKVRTFDMQDGDANEITKYINEEFDFVFSSHCLEHMHDPEMALKEWWELVKPGGHLIFIVPDEDLYEQGYFPSLFNEDHKATFTISKESSWSPRSYNVLDLVKSIKNSTLIKIKLEDNGYNRKLLNHSTYSRKGARIGHKIIKRLAPIFGVFGIKKHSLLNFFRLPIDQTSGDAVAQIEVILRKTG